MLALLFTANDQSLYGCINVVERARQARANLPVDRPRLLVLPIAARFEGKVEILIILRATAWQQTPLGELEPLPKSGRPVASSQWYNSDEAMANIVTSLIYTIESLSKQRDNI